jgi:radical SAM protein with 4Fe4S-binding SPASM domain
VSTPWRSKTSAAALIAKLRSDPHAPYSAMIEIADRCNEVCVHCYQVQGEKGEISTDEWKRIIDELAEMGVLFLTISGGEATLRHDFLEIVEHARARRFSVKLYTNGLTMTPELAGRLGELAVQEAQISLYSHRAEVHDWVTRVPGSWERTVAGARALIAAGVKVVLKTPIMTFNADDIDAYIAFVTSVGADYSLDPQIDPREDGDRVTESFRIDRDAYLRVRRHELLDGRKVEPHTASLERSVCGACSGNVHIEANGDMRPCTLLDVSLGDAREGVRAGWTSGAAESIRELRWADLHGCRDCDLRVHCGRCFSNARMETGDALGPYATACRRAIVRYELALGRPPQVDAEIGPFRERSAGVLEKIEDVLTDRDRELAVKNRWARPSEGAVPPSSAGPARPGELIQIRRPGARRARAERVPGAVTSPRD